MDKTRVREINQKYQELVADEDLMHNRDLHKRILTAWEMESPNFWRELREHPGIAEKLAFIVQEEMWQEMDNLLAAGYPVTDAREQAERACLMMEPEETGDL